MRGRTNVSNNGDGLNLGAEVKNMVVADGSNITAGNFVQYRLDESNKKYESNGFYNNNYNSGNGFSKVIPIETNRYILWYADSDVHGTPFIASLVDVSNGFNVLSAISVASRWYPDCCSLNDGNFAVCYMENNSEFTIKIYKVKNSLSLLGTYKVSSEIYFQIYNAHITQLEDSRIIVGSGANIIVCSYSNGRVEEYKHMEIDDSFATGATQSFSSINDWSMYSVGESKFIILPLFGNGSNYRSYLCLIDVSESETSVVIANTMASQYVNKSMFGNAFSINGKVLFSHGGGYSSSRNYDTSIYYIEDGELTQTKKINLLEEAADAFYDLTPNVTFGTNLDSSSSGTAQYVKEDVFFVAVLPRSDYYNDYNKDCRTAIYRVSYNPQTKSFSKSNIITIEGEESGRFSGYGKFFESENGDVYYMYETAMSGSGKTGRWLLRMTYKNGILAKGENTQYVENYSGKAAIGVAKESGKSGQTIEVYVPTPV